MPNITPTKSGKVWEYALTRKCADIFQIPLTQNSSSDNTTKETVYFLHNYDKWLNNAHCITLHSDTRSRGEDVRDVLIKINEREIIGIEPSLKFDIHLIGHPNKLTSHSILYE